MYPLSMYLAFTWRRYRYFKARVYALWVCDMTGNRNLAFQYCEGFFQGYYSGCYSKVSISLASVQAV